MYVRKTSIIEFQDKNFAMIEITEIIKKYSLPQK